MKYFKSFLQWLKSLYTKTGTANQQPELVHSEKLAMIEEIHDHTSHTSSTFFRNSQQSFKQTDDEDGGSGTRITTPQLQNSRGKIVSYLKIFQNPAILKTQKVNLLAKKFLNEFHTYADKDFFSATTGKNPGNKKTKNTKNRLSAVRTQALSPLVTISTTSHLFQLSPEDQHRDIAGANYPDTHYHPTENIAKKQRRNNVPPPAIWHTEPSTVNIKITPTSTTPKPAPTPHSPSKI